MKKIYKELLIVGLLAIGAAAPIDAGYLVVCREGAKLVKPSVAAVCANWLLNTLFPKAYPNWLHTSLAPQFGEIASGYKALKTEQLSFGNTAKRAILGPLVWVEKLYETVKYKKLFPAFEYKAQKLLVKE